MKIISFKNLLVLASVFLNLTFTFSAEDHTTETTNETDSIIAADGLDDCKYKYESGEPYDVAKAVGGYYAVTYQDVCDFGLVCFKKDELYGWVHIKSKKIVIPPIYSKKSSFSKNEANTAIVQLKKDGSNLYGVINLKGEYVMSLKKRPLEHWGNNLYTTWIDGKKKIINTDDEIVFEDFDFLNGTNDEKYYTIKDQGKKVYKDDYVFTAGVIDYNGKLVVPKVFKFVGNNRTFLAVSDGVICSTISTTGNKNWRYYIVDKGWLNENSYDTGRHFKDGEAKVTSGYKIGHLDLDGEEHWTGIDERKKERVDQKELIATSFDQTIPNYGGKTVIKNGKYGLANRKGEILIPLEYDSLGTFSKTKPNLATVKKDGKYGCINRENEIVIPITFDYTEPRELILVKQGKKFGYLDYQGMMVVLPKYDNLGRFSSGYCVATLDGKAGLMNKTGDLLVPCIYKVISTDINDGMVPVGDFNGKYGYTNLEGEVVIPLRFSGVTYFFHEEAAVKENGKFKIIDLSGRVKFEFGEGFQTAMPFKGTLGFIFKKDGKYGTMTNTGEVLVPNIIKSFAYNGDKTYSIKTIYGNGELQSNAQASDINKKSKEGGIINITNDLDRTMYVFQRQSYQTSEDDAQMYKLEPGKSKTLSYHSNSFIFLSTSGSTQSAKTILTPREEWQRKIMRTEVILLSQWIYLIDAKPQRVDGKVVY